MARVTIREGQLQSIKRVAITANKALHVLSKEILEQLGHDPEAVKDEGILGVTYPESAPFIMQHITALNLHDDEYGLEDIEYGSDEEIAQLAQDEYEADEIAENSEFPFKLDDALADPEVFMRDSVLTVTLLVGALAGTLRVLKERFPDEDIATTVPEVNNALSAAQTATSNLLIRFCGVSDEFLDGIEQQATQGVDKDTW